MFKVLCTLPSIILQTPRPTDQQQPFIQSFNRIINQTQMFTQHSKPFNN